ncbi:dTDP-glucose 4,6-dehydratase [Rickettsiales bacterium Ac37b]|nr:dTDP-glucose 4,6-dehydratase [Rickettsiales bacterium Ac37b]
MIIITGVGGFIGFHVAKFLLQEGRQVLGIDNLNDYYNVKLKLDRLEILKHYNNFTFEKLDISDTNAILSLSEQYSKTRIIINLAAQAGVRYSLENPFTYISSNIQGLINMLELSRRLPLLEHFISASSSSVYGNGVNMPLKVEDNTKKPISLYAATKSSGELMAYSYSHLYKIPMTVLRFFTVYGPWGRPDMAVYLFTKAIIDGKPLKLFNRGEMRRDFTYIDDIVAGIIGCINKPPITQTPPYKIYNLGNNNSVLLKDFLKILEECIGKKAIVVEEEMQPGDVQDTYADITDSIRDLNFKPQTDIKQGLERFVEWFRSYYKV